MRLNILVAAFVIMFVLPTRIFAGDMVIEEGTVFSDTFIKDGRRVEVTKTYTRDGVVIHQLIYDETTGALIRDKTTTNPIKDQVTLVPSGGDSSTPNPDPILVDESGVEQMSEKELEIDTSSKPEAESEEVDILNVEKNVGPESKVDDYQEMLGLTRVDKVFVSQTSGASEVAINGVKNRRFLGLIKIEIPVEYVLDSETGVIKSIGQSRTSRLLEVLSI